MVFSIKIKKISIVYLNKLVVIHQMILNSINMISDDIFII